MPTQTSVKLVDGSRSRSVSCFSLALISWVRFARAPIDMASAPAIQLGSGSITDPHAWRPPRFRAVRQQQQSRARTEMAHLSRERSEAKLVALRHAGLLPPPNRQVMPRAASAPQLIPADLSPLSPIKADAPVGFEGVAPFQLPTNLVGRRAQQAAVEVLKSVREVELLEFRPSEATGGHDRKAQQPHFALTGPLGWRRLR